MRARVVAMVVAAGLFVTACSGESASPTTTEADRGEPATTEPDTTVPDTTEPETTEPATTIPDTTEPATTVPETTVAPTTAATTVPPTTVAPTTVPPAPAPGQPNPACIVTVAPGDSLSLIVSRLGNPAVTADAVALENGLANPDTINVGAQLDVCPGNGLDDVTGAPRVPPTTPPTAPAPTPPPPVAGLASGVEAQQQKLNELFSPFGMRPLTVDGVSGRMTKQLLCAARLTLGLPVTRDDMVPGSPEEQSLMASTGLQIPPGAPIHAERWGLIDQHCQVLFVGQGAGPLVFVFPTSTGQSEYPTRDQNASRAFRFNPARDNGGWHNSIDYPVGPDNPLNGNMYKPLYFDRGQAIHGANTVPTSPASHGCARLRVPDQDALVNWLGLGDQGSQIWDNPSRINFTVTVVGRY